MWKPETGASPERSPTRCTVACVRASPSSGRGRRCGPCRARAPPTSSPACRLGLSHRGAAGPSTWPLAYGPSRTAAHWWRAGLHLRGSSRNGPFFCYRGAAPTALFSPTCLFSRLPGLAQQATYDERPRCTYSTTVSDDLVLNSPRLGPAFSTSTLSVQR